uniref:Uncharacterized protein n=1 Tax=Triticum urartu TaxID=4572 RepID=A0A8R7UWI7_TRIUA
MDWSLQEREREKEGEEGEREERGEGAAAVDGRASPTIASPPSPPSLLVNAAVSIPATSSSHAAASFRTPLRRHGNKGRSSQGVLILFS